MSLPLLPFRAPELTRRQFLQTAGLAAVAPWLPLGPFGTGAAGSPYGNSFGHPIDPSRMPRAPLRHATVMRGTDLSLRAHVHPAEIAPGVRAQVWTPGDGLIGPTIEARTGETLRVRLDNALPEQTILHWHGLRVPEAADGHPRLAIDPGATYRYEFPVIDRAGTYWYHSHAHHRTGIQAYRGMAGLFLVRDAEEDALGLPGGEHELPLFIQDRRLAADGTFEYDPMMHEAMEGFFGDAPFVNGVRLPRHDVDAGSHRLRLVNGSTSRILRIAFSNGQPFTLIGIDGGLLEQAVTLTTIDLGVGERADLVVDFGRVAVGRMVSLDTIAFDSPAMPGGMGMGRGMGAGMGAGMGRGRMGAGGVPQGGAMTLVAFHVTRARRTPAWKAPARLSAPLASLPPAARTRSFRFDSMRMQHTINGRSFDMERIDERVPFGTTEQWSFVNDSPFPHPVHMHEVQFRVMDRRGGRARIMPWEHGPKDTVLVLPGEEVTVRATFDSYRGRFLMHCHNVVHEDMGMMLNYEIV